MPLTHNLRNSALLVMLIACGKTQQSQSTTPHNNSVVVCTPTSCPVPEKAKPKPDNKPIQSTQQETPVSKSHCPDDMVFVSGEYCTEVKQECDVWLDPPGSKFARCQKFKPSVCVGERVHKEFCMDMDEYTTTNETLPMTNIDWYQAKQICEDQNKSLCTETEFNFACEGEQMFAYTTGNERNDIDCNYDRTKLLDNNGHWIDNRVSSASLTKCVSPFGIRNLNGNVDEQIIRDHTYGPFKSGLMSGWWGALRNRCRGITVSHWEYYKEITVGFRCCSQPSP